MKNKQNAAINDSIVDLLNQAKISGRMYSDKNKSIKSYEDIVEYIQPIEERVASLAKKQRPKFEDENITVPPFHVCIEASSPIAQKKINNDIDNAQRHLNQHRKNKTPGCLLDTILIERIKSNISTIEYLNKVQIYNPNYFKEINEQLSAATDETKIKQALAISELRQKKAENSEITKLDFAQLKISDTDAKNIADYLENNPQITDINLGNNDLSDSGVESIIEVLRKREAPTRLCLRKNYIKDCDWLRAYNDNKNLVIDLDDQKISAFSSLKK